MESHTPIKENNIKVLCKPQKREYKKYHAPSTLEKLIKILFKLYQKLILSKD